MAFCTNCGRPLTEGENHVCEVQTPVQPSLQPSVQNSVPSPMFEHQSGQPAYSSNTGSNTKDYGTLVKGELAKFEKGTLLGLLKNPFSALHLRGESDLRYGLIGLLASLIGYMMLAWSFKRNALYTVFELSGGGSRSDWRKGYAEFSDQFDVLSPIFVMGLVSLIALTAGAILLGNGMGTYRTSWKEGLAKIGSAQLVVGAGFLICALLMFVSLRLGFIALLIVLLTALALTLFVSAQLFHVAQARLLSFIALFTALMVAVIAITFNLQVQAGIENMAADLLGLPGNFGLFELLNEL
ncbi:hypothetical protein [Saccharibacillus kuerlensis]|uniref:Yip1 domain-containing protein n=1 Tax=Saccharibacillus kuerlensis TaxID=459527 RepID=A0ABQ2L820_9BACL|nr:hypothetical protein [Saccharibacillus kuerlensis]GGO06509.1 hypothetical protein GCM10010969_34090 [Saccharibacillus kuerlensis]